MKRARASGFPGKTIFLAAIGLTLAAVSPTIGAGFATRILRLDPGQFPAIEATLKVFTSQPTSLSADHFKIQEEGTAVASFTVRAQRPTQFVFVTLDRSSSIEPHMAQVKEAAGIFINTLPERVKAGVVSFASDVEFDQPCTEDRKALLEAIRKIRPYGGTCLYDVVWQGCEALSRLGRNTDIRTMVVLTDGRDANPRNTGPMSIKRLDQAIEIARKNKVNLFTIGLGADIDRTVLEEMAVKTGGASLQAKDTAQLRAIYERLGQRLQLEQYIGLTFRTPNPKEDGSLRRVTITSEWQDRREQGSDTYRAPLPAPAPLPPPPPPSPASFTPKMLEAKGLTLRQFSPLHEQLADPNLRETMRTAIEAANLNLTGIFERANAQLVPIFAEWQEHLAQGRIDPLENLRLRANQAIEEAQTGFNEETEKIEVLGASVGEALPEEDSIRNNWLWDLRAALINIRMDFNGERARLGLELGSNPVVNQMNKSEAEQALPASEPDPEPQEPPPPEEDSPVFDPPPDEE